MMAVILANYSNFPCKSSMSIWKGYKIGIWGGYNMMRAHWTDKPFEAGIVRVLRFLKSELTTVSVSERPWSP